MRTIFPLLMAAFIVSACSSTMQMKEGAASLYKDGIYIGEEPGWPDMTVEVTIENNRIQNVRFLNSNGTPSHTEMVVPVLPGRVIEAEYSEVDGVTGATLSSNNFLSAVRNAMEKAKR